VIPDLSVLWVIFFVLVLTVIVQKLLFAPILRVTHAREAAVRDARALAANAENKATAATEEYEARTGAARAEVYREMDATRRVALDRRAELLALTRQEADETHAEAAARIKAAADTARAQLQADAVTLSQAIVERVLDRKAS
jgi:F0F1-type ATP synthase membrane subunit b/b'